ncbi:MAG: hypothetical protein OHK93_004907 [Ramalina farinacea]|uniref:Uncharacterized protein n=1 Tax=Ramalina farinacea TaxID=258253 RepID=A0AA43QV37_9LECA|nr:hypothetical protein [Ramalina farinacea]
MADQHLGFGTLPPELRNQIYRLILPSTSLQPSQQTVPTSAMLVSHSEVASPLSAKDDQNDALVEAVTKQDDQTTALRRQSELLLSNAKKLEQVNATEKIMGTIAGQRELEDQLAPAKNVSRAERDALIEAPGRNEMRERAILIVTARLYTEMLGE